MIFVRETAVWALGVALATQYAFAAPIEKLLDDFEAELVGWSEDVQVVAADGGHALSWQPSGKQPYFMYLRFHDRGIEMSEWDRLEFRYKLSGAKVGWWGVKIVDHPLADGLQATYQIPREQVQTDVWQSASIELHPPQWIWGETPSENAQTISFRASSVSDGALTVLLDDIKVARDRLRLGAEPVGPVAADGAGFAREFSLSVENRSDEAMEVRLRASDLPAGVAVELPERSETPAGQSVALAATLRVRPVGGLALVPLTTCQATLVAVSEPPGDEAEVEVSMAIPLGEVEHPCLTIARSQIAAIKARVEQFEWASAAYDGLKKSADAWLEREIVFPDRGGQWSHWYTCEKCGSRLKTVSPTEHKCPNCGAVYSGWPYDDVIVGREHGRLARAAHDLGLMYALTEDEGYADRSREILLGYAERYLSYPLHNNRGDAKAGGRVMSQQLSEATWLIRIVQGFDCVYDTLSGEEREKIADDLLLPAAELVRAARRSIHNIPCWENAAFGLVGLTLGNEELAADAINGRLGFRGQVAEGISDEGVWYEGSWGYHYYTMSALEPLAVAAEQCGIDLYRERYSRMFLAPVQMMAPNGQMPAFNDSGRTSALGSGRARLYENAYAHWPLPEIAMVIASSNRANLSALLYGADAVPTSDTQLTSRDFPDAGIVIFRTTPQERVEGAIPGVPSNYLALDYGPHGSGHGHPDKLGFVFYAMGRLVAPDAGSIAYGNPAHRGWYKQTLSHSTVVADGASQQPCTGKLHFAAFDENAAFACASADDAYPGVHLLRAIALLGNRVLDVTVACSEDEHQYDWAYHSRGEFGTELPLTGLPEPPGEGAYEWAEGWRSAGQLEAWSARWQVDDELRVRCTQAVSRPAELLTAIGRGNPPSARDPFVVSRCRGKSAVWGTALLFGEGGEEATVRLLSDDAVPLEQGFGLEVVDGASRTLMLASEEGELSIGEVMLRGAGALLSWRDGELTFALLADGSEVALGGRTLNGE